MDTLMKNRRTHYAPEYGRPSLTARFASWTTPSYRSAIRRRPPPFGTAPDELAVLVARLVLMGTAFCARSPLLEAILLHSLDTVNTGTYEVKLR